MTERSREEERLPAKLYAGGRNPTPRQAYLVRVPAPILYDCGNSDTVTAYFYNDTPVPAAVLNLGGAVQDFAILHPSGSGAKYGGAKLTFWTKGDTALLIRAGKPDVSCSEKKR